MPPIHTPNHPDGHAAQRGLHARRDHDRRRDHRHPLGHRDSELHQESERVATEGLHREYEAHRDVGGELADGEQDGTHRRRLEDETARFGELHQEGTGLPVRRNLLGDDRRHVGGRRGHVLACGEPAARHSAGRVKPGLARRGEPRRAGRIGMAARVARRMKNRS